MVLHKGLTRCAVADPLTPESLMSTAVSLSLCAIFILAEEHSMAGRCTIFSNLPFLWAPLALCGVAIRRCSVQGELVQALQGLVCESTSCTWA